MIENSHIDVVTSANEAPIESTTCPPEPAKRVSICVASLMAARKRRQSREYRESPRGRYAHHKGTAKRRGIEFTLTFEEWWGLWEPFWDKRGKGSHQYCMARIGDEGPYALGNVRVVKNWENYFERV